MALEPTTSVSVKASLLAGSAPSFQDRVGLKCSGSIAVAGTCSGSPALFLTREFVCPVAQALTLLDLVEDTPSPMAVRRTSWLLAALIAVGTALAVPLPRVWRLAEVCAIASLSESDCETEAPSERSNLTPEFDPSTDCLRYEPRASSRRFWAANYRRPPPFPSLP